MATTAKKSKTGAKKTAKKRGASTPSPAAVQAAALAAELEAAAKKQADAGDEEDEEEEEDEDEDESRYLTTVDTRVYSVIRHDALATITGTSSSYVGAFKELASANAKQAETTHGGFHDALCSQREELREQIKYGREERDRASKLERDVAEKDRTISEMIRASEDSKLEIERLHAEVARGRIANEREAIHLDHKSVTHGQNLEAVKHMAGPTFARLGDAIVTNVVPEMLRRAGFPGGGGGGAPGAPSGPANGLGPGPAAGAPSVNGHAHGAHAAPAPGTYTVNLADVEPFRVALLDVLGNCGPEPFAFLRAVVCCATCEGAPALPDSTRRLLAMTTMRDVGSERTNRLLAATDAAFVSVEPPPATTGAGAPN